MPATVGRVYLDELAACINTDLAQRIIFSLSTKVNKIAIDILTCRSSLTAD